MEWTIREDDERTHLLEKLSRKIQKQDEPGSDELIKPSVTEQVKGGKSN